MPFPTEDAAASQFRLQLSNCRSDSSSCAATGAAGCLHPSPPVRRPTGSPDRARRPAAFLCADRIHGRDKAASWSRSLKARLENPAEPGPFRRSQKSLHRLKSDTRVAGGGGGIRTHDTAHHRIRTFQARAFNHSATPPRRHSGALKAPARGGTLARCAAGCNGLGPVPAGGATAVERGVARGCQEPASPPLAWSRRAC